MIFSLLRLPHPLAVNPLTEILARLTVLEAKVATLVVAARGYMVRNTNLVLGALGATYQSVTGYTSNSVSNIGVVTNLAAGTIRVLRPGTYQVIVTLGFTCLSQNSGRNTNLRLYDTVANAAVTGTFPIYVARDTDGGSTSVVLLAVVNSTSAEVVAQLGGSDSFTNFTITTAGLAIIGAGT